MINHMKNYVKSVERAFRLTKNIETSYYSSIFKLLEQFGINAVDVSSGRGGVTGENIDIKLWHQGDDVLDIEPFGGIEGKGIGQIDDEAKSKIKISAARYGNMILTDNMQWQFWHDGDEDMYAGVYLMKPVDGKLTLIEENVELFITLIEDFADREPIQIRSSNKLAEYMATYAKRIRTIIMRVLKENKNNQPLVNNTQQQKPMFNELYGLYLKIKEDLRPLLTTQKFADMYAQTIVYGLFIAKYNDKTSDRFDRYNAIGKLTEESALLNKFFTHIATSKKIHPTLETQIDKLCRLYQLCDISALLDKDARRDAIVHFYEDFLTYYDPVLKKEMGVFYTPYQAVQYLVSQVDRILVNVFKVKDGLANDETFSMTVPTESYFVKKKEKSTKEITVPSVAILDPACGTGTFHAEIIKYIKNKYFSGGNEAFYKEYIQNKVGLLSRLIGFELMMTSYVVAHLSMRRALDETLGHAPECKVPMNIFMTNTLAPPQSMVERNDQISIFDFSAAISEEAYNADTWKTRRPIKVIIGNPPYRSKSQNPYDISSYKTETDGVTNFREKKHNLNDDYVKFFHFAEQIINKNKKGVLAFVSSNGFLDNPTFRGMRGSLLRTFDHIHIINLHGSAYKNEVAPDGSRDENIFDIMQGVSLFIGIKLTTDSSWAKVYSADLWGLKNSKLKSLENGNIDFTELSLNNKMAFFVPFGNECFESYDNGIGLTELFPTNASGLVSGNNNIAYAETRDILVERIEIIRDAVDDNTILNLWGTLASGQTIKKIQDDTLDENSIITQLSFRPFVKRWTLFTGKSNGFLSRPIGAVSKQIINPNGNVGLVFTKGDTSPNDFSMIFVCNGLVDNRITAAQTAGYAQIAPLYIYEDSAEVRRANLCNNELLKLTEHMSFEPTPYEVLDYIYGILYDPTYREKYNEYLKRDYPRIPIINDINNRDNPHAFYVSEEKFRVYVNAGERLRQLHLMQIRIPIELEIEFATPENLIISNISYSDGVLSINENTRILGVLEDVWSYYIGGYQVLDTWLKSYRGQALSRSMFNYICDIAGLITETIRIQEELRSMSN